MDRPPRAKSRVVPVEIVQPATSLAAVAQSVVGPLLGPLGTAAVAFVFVLFMLIKREDLRDRIIHLIGRGRLSVTTQALDEAAGKVTGYLTMQVIINVCFGLPIGIGLHFHRRAERFPLGPVGDAAALHARTSARGSRWASRSRFRSR